MDSLFYRLVAPLILSIIVYFLILLVFDSIEHLEYNFFRAELILCLTISYLVSETNRLLIKILEKKLPDKIQLSKHIFIQVTSGSLLILIVTSGAVSFYMLKLVGFKSFNSELIVFNSLYIALGWCLHAVYFSMVYLKKVSDIQYHNEKKRREAIETKMETSLNNLQPRFLNKCLETLIVLTYKNPDLADEYVGRLSDFYRDKLTNDKNEFIGLNNELEAVQNFIEIQSYWTNVSITLKQNIINEEPQMQLLQGTIQLIVDYLLKIAIHLPKFPLNISLTKNKMSLELTCKISPRLNIKKQPSKEINQLNESYNFYCQKKIETSIIDGLFIAKIPLTNE